MIFIYLYIYLDRFDLDSYDSYFDDPIWKCNEEEPDNLVYYYATCKSKRSKFFPQFFSRGTRGKCILTDEKQWLTPVEFQNYAGCWHNDWKSSIKLTNPIHKNTKEKNKKNKLKNFIENKEINNVHQYLCECETCLDFSYLKVRKLFYYSICFYNLIDLEF